MEGNALKAIQVLRRVCVAALVGVAAASLVAGCATSRHRDWREAVKAGDYRAAYLDLFETWRMGTGDVKAEALRYAWRDPAIVAVARKDLVAGIQPIAEAHTGDLASLTKSVKDGPFEDRVEFAKLVDRNIDVDGEIKAAYGKRSPRTAAAPAVPAPAPAPAPAAPAPKADAPVRLAPPAPPPMAKSQPTEAVAPPAAKSPSVAASTPAPSAPKATQSTPTPPQPAPPAPPPASVEKAPTGDGAHARLLAQVAEEKKRSVWRCKGAAACDKAWLAAEGFVASNSDMRVRAVTPTSIDTYPPIVIGEIGMKVEKRTPGTGDSELELTVICRTGKLRQLCPTAELRLYKAFPAHLKASAAP
jgi:hypothetical protein